MSQKLLSFILSGLLLSSLGVTFRLHAANPGSDGDPVVIIVAPQNGSPTGAPRTSNATHIEAWYSWDTHSVSAILSNAGDVVEVEFNNLFTEEQYSYEIPGNGLSVMPIGQTAGLWTVKFTLSSGDVYSGVFCL